MLKSDVNPDKVFLESAVAIKATVFPLFVCLYTLEDTARYAGLLLAPAEGFGLRPRLFLPFERRRKKLIMLFWQILGFSSNFSNDKL